jgi:hypothetical protein
MELRREASKQDEDQAPAFCRSPERFAGAAIDAESGIRLDMYQLAKGLS